MLQILHYLTLAFITEEAANLIAAILSHNAKLQELAISTWNYVE